MRLLTSRQPSSFVCGLLALFWICSLSAAADVQKAQATEATEQNDANDDSALVQLKYRFEPNKTIHFKVTQTMLIHTKKGRAAQTSKGEWTTEKHLRVISLDDQENAMVESIIDRIKASVQFNDEDPQTYDSKSGKAPQRPFRSIGKTVGKPIARSQFAPNGRLITTILLRNATDSAFGGSAGPSDDPSRNFLITLPENPIRVGESWKDQFNVKVSVPPKLQRDVRLGRKYTLTKLKDGIATIKLQTSILTPLNSQAIKAQLIQRTPDGTIRFDVEKGAIVSRKLTVKGRVLGFNGEGSEMRAENVLVEKLIEPALATQSGSKLPSSTATK